MDRRQHHRIATRALALCRMPATPIPAELADVSKSGCAVRVQNNVVGMGRATVILTFCDQVEVSGEIVWVDHNRFGVEFHRQLDDDTIRQLTQSVPTRPRSAPPRVRVVVPQGTMLEGRRRARLLT